MENSSSTSVLEFLQSSRLSNGSVFLLRHEYKHDETSLSQGASVDGLTTKARARASRATGGSDGAWDGTSPRQLVIENAARVALLLARSFAERCQQHSNSAFISLDDFFIRFSNISNYERVQASESLPRSQRGDARQKILLLAIDNREERHQKLSDKIQKQTSEDDNYHKKKEQGQGIKTLGHLLHCVFSEGGRLPIDLDASTTTSLSSQETSVMTGRSSKIPRSSSSSTSIFSKLLKDQNNKNTALPSSICRLLSDMLDDDSVGPSSQYESNTDTPIESFEDVVLDLEQMIAAPCSFLHDDPYFPAKNRLSGLLPIFGQQHFGRKEKVARLIGIATEMEQAPLCNDPISTSASTVAANEEANEGSNNGGSAHINENESSNEAVVVSGAAGASKTSTSIATASEEPNEDSNINGNGSSSGHINSSNDSSSTIEAVFVSGAAGAGKSYFIGSVGDYLSNLGWIILKAKFERGKEYASRGVVSSLFDGLVSHLVDMRIDGGDASDKACGKRAADKILDDIGQGGLESLVDFLPSLTLLFDGIDIAGSENEGKEMIAEGALVFSLTKILEAVLESDRIILCFCDDLQWADKTSLALLTNFLINVGTTKHISRRVLFVGSYRDNAIHATHPFIDQYSFLQTHDSVNTTEIKLSSLPAEAVIDMLMVELRLPRRMLLELADAVHRKTSGHVYFVVELLNSLVRDSTIAYNAQKRRYDWDQDIIASMSVSNTVAELIAVNLSYLPPELLRVLRIISCFGIQACVSLLEILEDFQGGLIAAVNPFVQQGILDKAGPLVIFAHDLIQQEIYEGIPSGERSNLHLEIGQFLRKQLELATTIGMEQLSLDDRTFYAGRRSITSSLLSLACDQINSSGPQNFSDYNQRRDFAELNLASGQKCARESNFRAALYYFSKGIYLLHNDCGNNSVDQPQQSCWLTCARLCRALRQGAVNASFALGESDGVYRYAKEVVANSTFEDTLEVQQVVLRSLSQSGRHEECISTGTNILRRLNFDFAESPPKSSILIAMKSTDVIIAQCSLDRMMSRE